MQLVLGLICRDRRGHDLFGDLLELEVYLRTGIPRDPRAIDRHHPRLHQPRLLTQLQSLGEQTGQRQLMTINEPRDRRVIGHQIAGDHPISNILSTVTLNPTRRPHARRKRVHDQRHHHRRLVRRPPMTIGAIRGVERRQVHPLDRADHKPRQMIGRKPIPHIRRQQKPLLTATLDEVLRHTAIVFTGPDRPLYATTSTTRNSARPDSRMRATQKYARWPGQPTGLEPSPRYLSPSKGAARAP